MLVTLFSSGGQALTGRSTHTDDGSLLHVAQQKSLKATPSIFSLLHVVPAQVAHAEWHSLRYAAVGESVAVGEAINTRPG